MSRYRKPILTTVFASGPPSDPDFIVSVRPILYKDQAYTPPKLIPETREEAICLLTRCGFHALAVPTHLIRAFCFVRRHRAKIQEGKYQVYDPDEALVEPFKANTDVLVAKWLTNKPGLFSGLPNLAEWLQHAAGLAGVPNIFGRPCAQKLPYENLYSMALDEIKLSELDDLANGLEDITDFCTRKWTFPTYLTLALHYAESVPKRTNGRKIAVAERKRILLSKLKSSGLYGTTIPKYLYNSHDEWEVNEEAASIIAGFEESLENENIPLEEIIKQLSYTSGSPLQNRTPSDNIEQDDNVDSAEPFLRSDKHFSKEFLVWFCVAIVEVHLATLLDPQVGPQKITSWSIYEKMFELNGNVHIAPGKPSPKKPEKDIKEQVAQVISYCKKRLKDSGLPALEKTSISSDLIAQYIDFFQNIPEVAKYFSRTTYTQQYITQGNTVVSSVPPKDCTNITQQMPK